MEHLAPRYREASASEAAVHGPFAAAPVSKPRWADLCSSGEEGAEEEAQNASSPKRRWADFSDSDVLSEKDEDEQDKEESQDEDAASGSATRDADKAEAHARPRWADITSSDDDEDDPWHVEPPAPAEASSGSRGSTSPSLKPGEGKKLSDLVEKFCSLDSAGVGSQEQEALLVDMIGTLKLLASADAVKTSSGGSAALVRAQRALSTASGQRTLERHIQLAEQLHQSHSFERAFEVLRDLRPWLRGLSPAPVLAQDFPVHSTGWEVVKTKTRQKREKAEESAPDQQVDHGASRRAPAAQERGVARVASGASRAATAQANGAARGTPSVKQAALTKGDVARGAKATKQAAPVHKKGGAEVAKQAAPSQRRATARSEAQDAAHLAKLQCQFLIGIEEEPEFHAVRKVLGGAGSNMKKIAGDTGVKLRLRGRGSKFLEGPAQEESSDPLMLCVSAPSRSAYDAAVVMVRSLLHSVYHEYDQHLEKKGLPPSGLQVKLHTG